MKKISVLVLSLLISIGAQASKVAVVDSGTDFSHEWLQNRVWVNSKEVDGNLVDDDRNGKVDDVVGWDFAGNYGQIFFPEHLYSLDTNRLFKLFDVIGRIQGETDTAADRKYLDENVRNLPKEQKEALIAQLNFYGQYAHSTHVSGIVALMAPQAKIMSGRVFPDAPLANVNIQQDKMGPVDYIYKLLAMVSSQMFHQVGSYLQERGAQVANYSLGVPLSMIAKLSLTARGNKNPTPEQISQETHRMANQYIPEGEKWMASSPKTLFVIAAGNDGQDNNVFPTFPANVRATNSITVAATIGNAKLASFSNYGQTTVDIAAPGTAILSSVPSLDHKAVVPMSGTSMAAPYITGVAAHILDVNPALNAQQVKAILMGTVDHKDWLVKKVVSEGVVNPTRAYKAAELMKSMPIMEALAQAKALVVDQPVADVPARPMSALNKDLRDLANSIVF